MEEGVKEKVYGVESRGDDVDGVDSEDGRRSERLDLDMKTISRNRQSARSSRLLSVVCFPHVSSIALTNFLTSFFASKEFKKMLLGRGSGFFCIAVAEREVDLTLCTSFLVYMEVLGAGVGAGLGAGLDLDLFLGVVGVAGVVSAGRVA